MPADLTDSRDGVQRHEVGAAARIEQSIAAAGASACDRAFLATDFAGARAAAAAADRAVAAGRDPGPLAGLAVSIKDLFDVEGEPTRAASVALADAAPAAQDAPAVARLRRAGAAFIGRTNMSEFAFSGVGINPHHGTPANPATARLDPTPRIPGGSTSGGAVSVRRGRGLGRARLRHRRLDPHPRRPLQGLVGFKGTARRVPIAGAVPLSTDADTVSAMTLSVRDAVCCARGARRPRGRARRAGRSPRCASAVPRTTGARRPRADRSAAPSTRRSPGLAAAGATIGAIELPLLGEIASINASGGFAAAESWTWHRKLLAERGADYDPRVALRHRRGAAMSAADYIELLARAATGSPAWKRRCGPYDALLSPTVPIVAPAIGRSSPATRPSSPPTACCCATLRSSTCSTAAPSACRATPKASCRSG
jgi:amidase/aspartyl-tRNA(Asn)/glutamyl-tRNA(Gln) amidotransferase subunit A